MNAPVAAVIVVIALILGSTLSIMNEACKSGYHAWCSPTSTIRHSLCDKLGPPRSVMSAFGGKADISRTFPNVCF